MPANPVWMTQLPGLNRLYALDNTRKTIWVWDTTSPSGSSQVTRFDVSGITVGINKIGAETSTNTLWLSDGVTTLFSLDGTTGAITSYDESAHVSGNITDFAVDSHAHIVLVADSGGNLSQFSNTGFFGFVLFSGTVTDHININSRSYQVSFTYMGPTTVGIETSAGGMIFGQPNFALESNPAVFSAVWADQLDAVLTAVHDTNGTGTDQLSVWNNGNTEAFRYSWPGTGFSGYLVSYTDNSMSLTQYVYGLDTTGVLYQMNGGLGPAPYTAPAWTPTAIQTFAEPCINLVPEGNYQGGTHHFVWALGQGLGVYRYNFTLDSIDLHYTYDFTVFVLASLLADSDVAADLEVKRFVDASLVSDSSLTAHLSIDYAVDAAITANSLFRAAPTVAVDASLTANSAILAQLLNTHLVSANPHADSSVSGTLHYAVEAERASILADSFFAAVAVVTNRIPLKAPVQGRPVVSPIHTPHYEIKRQPR